MTDLVTCLSSGKGTWGQVIKLVNSEKFRHVYIMANEYGEQHFNPSEHTSLLTIDQSVSVAELRDTMEEFLEDLHGPEVAVNIASGSGKEHMALISAILNQGCGIRFVKANDGIEEI